MRARGSSGLGGQVWLDPGIARPAGSSVGIENRVSLFESPSLVGCWRGQNEVQLYSVLKQEEVP